MRQRKIKEIEKKIRAFDKYLVSDSENQKGHWRDVFSSLRDDNVESVGNNKNVESVHSDNNEENIEKEDKELFAEIGCGKGRFITGLAMKNPERLYLGFEGNETVIYRALQKVQLLDEVNHEVASCIKLCPSYIYNPMDVFSENELNGIYLNFSDPWPKAKHEKRRLTQSFFVKGYWHSLKLGGKLELKTDNEDFFKYSLERFKDESGFEIISVIEDIQRSEFALENVETEYEHKFNNLRRRIKFLRVVKK